jgi:hypothetical protein
MLVMGMIGANSGTANFYIRYNFWASSSHAGRAEGAKRVTPVRVHALDQEISEYHPTFLIMDIEGGEESLIGSSDLSGINKIMMELHPDLIGDSGVDRVLSWLRVLGFVLDVSIGTRNVVFLKSNSLNVPFKAL